MKKTSNTFAKKMLHYERGSLIKLLKVMSNSDISSTSIL